MPSLPEGTTREDWSNNWLTVPEAAHELQTSQNTIRRAIKAGTLKAIKPTRDYFIRKDWLEEYRNAH